MESCLNTTFVSKLRYDWCATSGWIDWFGKAMLTCPMMECWAKTWSTLVISYVWVDTVVIQSPTYLGLQLMQCRYEIVASRINSINTIYLPHAKPI